MIKDRNIVQAIVVRTDLDMNIGKISGQVAHASNINFINHMNFVKENGIYKYNLEYDENDLMYGWLNGIYTKIVLGIKSEQKLLNLVEKANDNNINNNIIVDEGKTLFNNEKIITCACFGLVEKEEINKLTKRLRLL